MIDCFIPYSPSAEQTLRSLRTSGLVNRVFILSVGEQPPIADCDMLAVDGLQSTETMSKIASLCKSDYCLIYTKSTPLELGQFALERLLQTAEDTKAGMVYCDYHQMLDGKRKDIPTIDYQIGSVRDDFNFGSLMLFSSSALQETTKRMNKHYHFAGLYDLRLKLSQKNIIFHLNEYLYTEEENDNRKSGEKQFDYVDPKNRAMQLEMEQVCTEHLKAIGAYLNPVFKTIDISEESFATEASVIIPVRNRVKTIEDAIQSVFSQETSFAFNLIIIDNHSTDGTSELIKKYAAKDKRLLHIIPERKDLGIGGCWNKGVQHEACGRFAVQLDSDDVYSSPHTLQLIVDTFHREQCAMVIGSYTMTDFSMQTIAPGLIDHKEWTAENGRNNALRINGLGAPRAFFTPLLRRIKVPNTSYGEDYALGLRISRHYQIGRIYESIYLCRRWDENSDAALDINKINAYNSYKDKLRSIEILARANS